MHRLQQFYERLATSGQHRLTPQRADILQILLQHSEEHLSAEEIHALVSETNPGIGLATVYRTLDLLEQLNLVLKVNFGDGKSRYDLRKDDEPHHHHHLICLSCGRIAEVRQDLLHNLEETVGREHGFTVVDHRLQFFGYCADCSSPTEN